MDLALDFLKESLRFNQEYKEALDRKASFLLGIASVVLVVSSNNITNPGFLLVGLGALVSSVFSVWVISFPFRRTHKGKFSLMCAWGFEHLSEGEYSQQIERLINDPTAMLATYKQEIFALSEYSIKIKLKFIKLASLALTLGLAVGFAVVLLNRAPA